MGLDARVLTTLLPLLTQSTENDKVLWREQFSYYQTRFLEWDVAIKRTGDIVTIVLRDKNGRSLGQDDVDDDRARALHDAVLAQTTDDPAEVSLTQLLSMKQQDRVFLPVSWQKIGVTAGQTTGVPMDIPGMSLTAFPLAHAGSLVSVGIVLSEAVTAGFIRLELTSNGTPTGKTLDITSAQGTKHIWEFAAGELSGSKGQELGINWGSNTGLLPSGTIELNVFFEVQWII